LQGHDIEGPIVVASKRVIVERAGKGTVRIVVKKDKKKQEKGGKR